MAISDNLTAIVFRLGGVVCAMPLSEIGEVTPWATLSPTPGLPGFILGFLNLRGALLPVISVERLFGGPAESSSPEERIQQRILVLKTAPNAVGIAARQPTEVCVLPAPTTDSHGSALGHAVVGQTMLNGSIVQVLSAAKILEAEEHQFLADFAAKHATRLLQWKERD